MSGDSRSPASILDSISKKSAKLREHATALTERIKFFEEYLSKLPGRVDTEYFGTHPDAVTLEEKKAMQFSIKLHRSGKSWALSYSTFSLATGDPDSTTEYKPLIDAPLKIKIAAMRLFPDFLAAIGDHQDQLVHEIAGATADFDQFIVMLNAAPISAERAARTRIGASATDDVNENIRLINEHFIRLTDIVPGSQRKEGK